MLDGHLFAFSGPRANNKTAVFHEAEKLMRERYPHLPVVFMDDVVSKKPLPTRRGKKHRALHPTSRLAKDFAEFNEAGVRKIRPAIEAGNIVVTLRYGLDVFLDSIAKTDCPQARHEASELWHKHLVPARVVRGTPKPQYLISQMKPRGGKVLTLCSEQERDVREYFEGTGQKLPIYLTGKTSKECAEEAVLHILAITGECRKTAT